MIYEIFTNDDIFYQRQIASATKDLLPEDIRKQLYLKAKDVYFGCDIIITRVESILWQNDDKKALDAVYSLLNQGYDFSALGDEALENGYGMQQQVNSQHTIPITIKGTENLKNNYSVSAPGGWDSADTGEYSITGYVEILPRLTSGSFLVMYAPKVYTNKLIEDIFSIFRQKLLFVINEYKKASVILRAIMLNEYKDLLEPRITDPEESNKKEGGY